MRIGNVDVQTVDELLDVLEHTFKSDLWRQLPQQDKIRLVGRLSHIMEIAARKELEE